MKVSAALCLFFVALNLRTEPFPSEFVGHWKYDVDAVRDYIAGMDISEDVKVKLDSSYTHMNRGESLRVTVDGILTFDHAPSDLRWQLNLIERTDNGCIIRITELVEKHGGLILMRIENGRWFWIEIDADREPLAAIPADIWQRIDMNN